MNFKIKLFLLAVRGHERGVGESWGDNRVGLGDVWEVGVRIP